MIAIFVVPDADNGYEHNHGSGVKVFDETATTSRIYWHH